MARKPRPQPSQPTQPELPPSGQLHSANASTQENEGRASQISQDDIQRIIAALLQVQKGAEKSAGIRGYITSAIQFALTAFLGLLLWNAKLYIDDIRTLQQDFSVMRASTSAIAANVQTLSSDRDVFRKIPELIAEMRGQMATKDQVASAHELDAISRSLAELAKEIGEHRQKVELLDGSVSDSRKSLGELINSLSSFATKDDLLRTSSAVELLAKNVKSIAPSVKPSSAQAAVVIDLPNALPTDQVTEVKFEIPIASLASDPRFQKGTTSSVRLKTEKGELTVNSVARVATYESNTLRLTYTFQTEKDAATFRSDVRFQKPQLEAVIDVVLDP